MSDPRVEFFFSYRNGDAKQVTKEEWEKEWLDWWTKKCSDGERGKETKES